MNETNYIVDGPEYKKDKSFSWNMLLSIAFGLGGKDAAGRFIDKLGEEVSHHQSL